MNTALLEELVRRKAESLQAEGVSVSEALDRAGEEIMNCIAGSGGHGARFCLRMWLRGAKRRLCPECAGESPAPEGDKRFSLIKCASGHWAEDWTRQVH